MIAALADVADYMTRLIGVVDPKGRGLDIPLILQDPASLTAPTADLYCPFRQELHASLRGVQRRRLVRGSQARRIAYLLDERVHERWTLARLTSVTRMSRSHLARVFGREMGMTVHNYVARAKILRAVDLIKAGEKIESAMLRLGYRNKTSFYQLFWRYAGVGPSHVATARDASGGLTGRYTRRTEGHPVTSAGLLAAQGEHEQHVGGERCNSRDDHCNEGIHFEPPEADSAAIVTGDGGQRCGFRVCPTSRLE